MSVGTLQNEKIKQLLLHLADRLQHTDGKKQYGYLRPELKNMVDEIVDELARDQQVADAYALWQEYKGQIENIYTEKTSQPLPLSKCGDFKPIRNMVIKEAMALADGTLTFEEPATAEVTLLEPTTEDDTPAPELEDEVAEPTAPPQRKDRNGRLDGSIRGGGNSDRPSWWSAEYKLAKQYLFGDESANIVQDFDAARTLLLSESEKSNPLAMCDLGRVYADGLGVEPDADATHQWYVKALSVFHAAESAKPWKYTEYHIGKMYAAGLGTGQDYETAARWLTLSADQGYKYAQYSLGGLYYRGNGVEQSYEIAFELYTKAAKQAIKNMSMQQRRPMKRAALFHRIGNRHS